MHSPPCCMMVRNRFERFWQRFHRLTLAKIDGVFIAPCHVVLVGGCGWLRLWLVVVGCYWRLPPDASGARHPGSNTGHLGAARTRHLG